MVVLASIRGVIGLTNRIFKICKSFFVKNNLEGQGQSTSYSKSNHRSSRFIFDATFVILAQIVDELSSGQSQIMSFLWNFSEIDLEDQCQSTSNSMCLDKSPRCMVGANLVILAQIFGLWEAKLWKKGHSTNQLVISDCLMGCKAE